MCCKCAPIHPPLFFSRVQWAIRLSCGPSPPRDAGSLRVKDPGLHTSLMDLSHSMLPVKALMFKGAFFVIQGRAVVEAQG